jgi:hypothetical protein
MGRIAPFSLCVAALAATAGTIGAWPARAQCRLCDSPTTQREAAGHSEQIELEIETSLNFDRLLLFGAGEGSALIRPDGARSAAGSVADIGPRAMVGKAVIHGQPGRAVRIDVPPQIELYSLGGGTISFDQVTSDLPAMPRLDSAGRLTFRFGGRIRIRGDAEGDYRGALPITVEYQ